MSEKKEKITNGQNIEIDGITVINEGISLSEDEKKEEQVVAPETEETGENEISSEVSNEVSKVEEDLPTPDVKIDNNEVASVQEEAKAEVTEEPVIPIDLEGLNVDMPDMNVSLDSPVDNSIPDLSASMEFSPNQDFSNPSMYSEISSDSSLGYDAQEDNAEDYNATSLTNLEDYNSLDSNSTFDSIDSGVFKTSSDVDTAFERFISDVRESYEKNISGPTKILVEFVNKFVNWGNRVTANGLNRTLFDEYDELIDLLKNTKSFNLNENSVNVNEFGTENAVYNDNNPSFNNFGDDQINNGGMFFN